MANSSDFFSTELPPETMSDSVVFPPDIITEILSRLPVKPLLRFRCVSKPWSYLIDSKEFAKQQLKQSVISNTNINLILGFHKSISSFSLDSIHLTGRISLDDVERLPVPVPPLSDSVSVLLNSCNGLSLVQIQNKINTKVSHLYIWNTFTRKYRELPVTPFEYPIGHELDLNERYAFAYVSETDEYKVVRTIDFSRFNGILGGSWLRTEAKIFSSASNEWEKVEDFPYRVRGLGGHKDGILHTVVYNDVSSAWSIMGFDVKSKQHAIVPNPNLCVSEIASITFEVLGGCLALINQDWKDSKADVWVMKDYGVKDSWSKVMSVAVEPFESSFWSLRGSGCLQPLAYSKDGEEVLLIEIDKRLYWYNLRMRTEREVTINMPCDFYTQVCFESLVSFPGFISVGNVKGESEGDLKKEKKMSWGFSMKDFKLVL